MGRYKHIHILTAHFCCYINQNGFLIKSNTSLWLWTRIAGLCWQQNSSADNGDSWRQQANGATVAVSLGDNCTNTAFCAPRAHHINVLWESRSGNVWAVCIMDGSCDSQNLRETKSGSMVLRRRTWGLSLESAHCCSLCIEIGVCCLVLCTALRASLNL